MSTSAAAATPDFQQFMPGDRCFGCGRENASGLHVSSHWQGDQCVSRWQPQEQHQGWNGVVCGGILATLIDCHCMASAMAFAVRREARELGSEPRYRFATGSLQIRYLKPTPLQGPLTLVAELLEIRKQRIYTLSCKVYSNRLLTCEATVTAFLVYRSDQPDGDRSPFSTR